ncbi:MAG: DUF3143 domain-containing protein [Prochlorotrichaceae cyanobacterium]
MSLPPAKTPLYNHSLTAIEAWLRDRGCEQDEQQRNCWQVKQADWEADIEMDIEEIVVRYHSSQSDQTVQRSFSYALCREDLDAVIFSGP